MAKKNCENCLFGINMDAEKCWIEGMLACGRKENKFDREYEREKWYINLPTIDQKIRVRASKCAVPPSGYCKGWISNEIEEPSEEPNIGGSIIAIILILALIIVAIFLFNN